MYITGRQQNENRIFTVWRHTSCGEKYWVYHVSFAKHSFEVLVLPELSICGYLFSSRNELLACAESIPTGASTQRMMSLSEEYSCTIILGWLKLKTVKFITQLLLSARENILGNIEKYTYRILKKGCLTEELKIQSLKWME